MATAKTSASANRKYLWLALLATALIAFSIVFIPAWIIQPFKPQTSRGVELSYMLRSWSPWITVVTLVIGLWLIAKLWRSAHGRTAERGQAPSLTARILKRALLLVILIPLLASTWFARQNHFEWMFNPLPNAAYAKANDVTFVADSDVVLAIEINGEAVAYPVRLMAYHHLVEDVVGGTPIVATY